MKKLGVLLAVFFVMALCTHSAHGADGQKARVKKEASTQGTVVAQPESKNTDIKENVDDKIIDFYKSLASNALAFTGLVIALFAGVSVFLVFKGYQLNKDAHKELDEIYEIKDSIYALRDSTRDYLDKAKESMDKFVKESETQISGLIEQGKIDLEGLRDKVEKIATKAQDSAEEAKASEDKSKATEYFMEAYRLGEQGKYEEAIAAYDKAIALDKENWAVYTNKGNALSDLGRYSEAIAEYDKAIEFGPNETFPYNNKGNILRILGKYSEAIAEYDKAIELDPKYMNAYNNKGYASIFLARYDDAIKYIKKSLEFKPEYRTTRINMALALQKRNKPGDTEAAKVILGKLITENDKDDDAARAYALLGERNKMLSLVRALVAEKPSLNLKFRADLEFEAYRDDPELKAIIGG